MKLLVFSAIVTAAAPVVAAPSKRPPQTPSSPTGPATPNDPLAGASPTAPVGPANPPSPFPEWWKDPARSWVFTHRTKGSAWAPFVLIERGTSGVDFVTCLDHPRLNGQPEAIVQVTPTMSPDATDLVPYESGFFGRENILYTSAAVEQLWRERVKQAGGAPKEFPLPRDRWRVRVAAHESNRDNGQCDLTGFYLLVPIVHCRPDAKDVITAELPMLTAQFEASAWNITFSLPPGAGK